MEISREQIEQTLLKQGFSLAQLASQPQHLDTAAKAVHGALPWAARMAVSQAKVRGLLEGLVNRAGDAVAVRMPVEGAQEAEPMVMTEAVSPSASEEIVPLRAETVKKEGAPTMRVTIDHEEGQRKTGWIGGKENIHIVKVGVQFADAERHVIENTPGLSKMIVVELPNWEEPDKESLAHIQNVSVHSLLSSPFDRRFQTIADARMFVRELKEKLPLLKEEIEANAEIPEDEKHETFEL